MIDCTGQSEVRYYYHYDGCGNVIALSNTAGQIVEAYSYDHFGSPTVMTGPGADGDWATYGDNPTASPVASQLDNPWMFTGRQYDPETSLYYYRARYYHPALGRFLQTDPIGYATGLNLYTYCGNNAVNWTDPYGLYGWSSNLGIGDNILANIYEGVGDAIGGYEPYAKPVAAVAVGAAAIATGIGPAVTATSATVELVASVKVACGAVMASLGGAVILETATGGDVPENFPLGVGEMAGLGFGGEKWQGVGGLLEVGTGLGSNMSTLEKLLAGEAALQNAIDIANAMNRASKKK